MKKFTILAIIVLTAILAVSCNLQKKDQNTNSSGTINNIVYKGVVPEADGAGFFYQLIVIGLQNDKGSYQLHLTSLEEENQKSKEISTSEGKLEVYKKTNKYSGKTIYKLIPNDGSDEIYLIVKDENTLRRLNKELEELGGEGLDYDLDIIK